MKSIIIAMAESDQCALNPDGSLKDASEIEFIHDPDDARPVTSSTTQPLGRGHRTKRMDLFSKSIAREQLGSDIEDDEGFVAPPKRRRARRTVANTGRTASLGTRNSFERLSGEENATDADDGNFSDDIPALQSCSDSDDGGDTDTDFEMITNEEVSLFICLLISFI